MPFWRLYYYLVWPTVAREPLITPEVEPCLYAYLASKGAELGLYTYAINGWTDHIHMLKETP